MKTETTNTKLNNGISSRRVNIIGDNGERLGEFETKDAVAMAAEKGLDLVEVDNKNGMSVCRFMDYSKWLYNKKKKQKSSKQTKVKQLTFSPRTEEHDLMILLKKAKTFLSEGDKVTFMIRFKGRENAHKDIGFEKMNFLLQTLGEEVLVESPPKLSGNQLSMQVTASK